MTWGKQWTNMDELLRKVAFISMRLHRTIWCHGVQSQVRASLHPLHCIWTPHPRWWMCYVGRLRNRPIKVINGSTRTPGRPRAACLRPNLLLKIEFLSFYLHRHGVSKDYSCQFLLLSILLSIAYLLKCTLHDHLT